MRTRLLALALASASFACASTSSPAIVDADPVARTPLLSAVSALEGRWEGLSPEGESKITEFKVIAAGSAVREIMLIGEPHEMTNMYSLDGNSLVMTHYCAGGNQPRMRALAMTGTRLEFVADGVADLKSAEDVYMGSMTLEFIDSEHIVQHWNALKAGEVEDVMSIEMTRVK